MTREGTLTNDRRCLCVNVLVRAIYFIFKVCESEVILDFCVFFFETGLLSFITRQLIEVSRSLILLLYLYLYHSNSEIPMVKTLSQKKKKKNIYIYIYVRAKNELSAQKQ